VVITNIKVSLQKQSVSAKVISYRKYKSIDKEAFLADLRVSSLVLDPKILNIPSEFPSSTLSQGKPLVEESCMSMMDIFEPLQRRTSDSC